MCLQHPSKQASKSSQLFSLNLSVNERRRTAEHGPPTPALQQPLLGRRASTAAELLLDGAMVENQADPEEEYSVKGGVWEQPDDGSREATEVGFGIKFLKHHNSAHKDKLLEYSTQQLGVATLGHHPR